MAKGVEILSRINQPSADINFDWSDSIPVEVDGIKMNVYYSKKLKDYYVTIDNLGKDLFGMNSVSVTLFNHDDRRCVFITQVYLRIMQTKRQQCIMQWLTYKSNLKFLRQILLHCHQ